MKLQCVQYKKCQPNFAFFKNTKTRPVALPTKACFLFLTHKEDSKTFVRIVSLVFLEWEGGLTLAFVFPPLKHPKCR